MPPEQDKTSLLKTITNDMPRSIRPRAGMQPGPLPTPPPLQAPQSVAPPPQALALETEQAQAAREAPLPASPFAEVSRYGSFDDAAAALLPPAYKPGAHLVLILDKQGASLNGARLQDATMSASREDDGFSVSLTARFLALALALVLSSCGFTYNPRDQQLGMSVDAVQAYQLYQAYKTTLEARDAARASAKAARNVQPKQPRAVLP